ncbi:MAG TPA: hypothetical protein VFA64_03170 [Hyphomicrobiaceae bacterium]|nr:hypothetical protein [Hyphomicrobiaceae bacterium]
MSRLLSPDPAPSPEEIAAAIRRAHHERAVALRRILASLFRGTGKAPAPPAGAVGATARH